MYSHKNFPYPLPTKSLCEYRVAHEMSYHYHINPCSLFLRGFCKRSVPKETRKCSTAQSSHREVVLRAFWRLVSKSCDEGKGSFARGCAAKRWSHWTCSSLGTILQPMRINSVPHVKCFCNNKDVLCVQSMVWHFVRHPPTVHHFTNWCAGFELWSILTVHDICRIFHELQHSLVRLQHPYSEVTILVGL
jgi:hypothetical protein